MAHDVEITTNGLEVDVDVISENEIEVSVFSSLVTSAPSFGQITVQGQNPINATVAGDNLTIIEGQNVSISVDELNKTITVNASLDIVDGGVVV